jgi:hypothetical protein
MRNVLAVGNCVYECMSAHATKFLATALSDYHTEGSPGPWSHGSAETLVYSWVMDVFWTYTAGGENIRVTDPKMFPLPSKFATYSTDLIIDFANPTKVCYDTSTHTVFSGDRLKVTFDWKDIFDEFHTHGRKAYVKTDMCTLSNNPGLRFFFVTAPSGLRAALGETPKERPFLEMRMLGIDDGFIINHLWPDKMIGRWPFKKLMSLDVYNRPLSGA